LAVGAAEPQAIENRLLGVSKRSGQCSAGELHGSEGVLEARVLGTGPDEPSCGQLVDLAKSLHRPSVDHPAFEI
jgi:hypothetical protein